MALIGSGSWRDIPNFYTAGSFVSSQADTGFGAVVDQVGGTSWSTGSPVTRAGNLDENNFSATPGFPNASKQEAYSPFYICNYIKYPNNAYGGTTVRQHHFFVVPLPMLLDRMTVSFSGPTYQLVDYYIDLIQNGNIFTPALRWSASATALSFFLVKQAPITLVNFPYSISRSALEGPLQLSTGDVLSIFFPQAVAIQDVHITLACRVLHQP